MRDERTKLLTFVNTWIDGVPSNLDKSLAKMEDELEQGEEQRRERGKHREWARAGLRVYIGTNLVPVGKTNRDKRSTSSPGL
jgi:hypothetical protein